MKKLDFSDMEALKVVIAWRWGKKILISLARRIFPRPFLLSCFSSFFSPAWWLFQDDPWHLVSPCPLDTHWDLIFRETSAKTVETIEVGDKKSGACRKQGSAADNRGNALGDNRRREMPSIWTTLTQKSFFPGSNPKFFSKGEMTMIHRCSQLSLLGHLGLEGLVGLVNYCTLALSVIRTRDR